MKFDKTISVSIFLSICFSYLQAQVNTESMRNAILADTLMHTLELDMGLEKSNEEVFDASLNYRFDYSPNDNYSAFIVLNYENGYERLLNASKNFPCKTLNVIRYLWKNSLRNSVFLTL